LRPSERSGRDAGSRPFADDLVVSDRDVGADHRASGTVERLRRRTVDERSVVLRVASGGGTRRPDETEGTDCRRLDGTEERAAARVVRVDTIDRDRPDK
jgi:hypothetical protein